MDFLDEQSLVLAEMPQLPGTIANKDGIHPHAGEVSGLQAMD